MPLHRQALPLLAVLAGTLLLSGCSSVTRDSGPSKTKDFSSLPDAVPRHEQRTRAGNPLPT